MDLHGIVRGSIVAVNPEVVATLYQSAGSTADADGFRAPNYITTTAMVQVQALSTKDLEHTNSLNITGITRKVYLAGNQWASVVRNSLRGGDIFNFMGNDWLINVVAEQWPDWTAVIVTQQADILYPTAPPAGFSIINALHSGDENSSGSYSVAIGLHVMGLTGPVTATATFLSGDQITFTFDPLIILVDGDYALQMLAVYSNRVADWTVYTIAVTIGEVTNEATYAMEFVGLVAPAILLAIPNGLAVNSFSEPPQVVIDYMPFRVSNCTGSVLVDVFFLNPQDFPPGALGLDATPMSVSGSGEYFLELSLTVSAQLPDSIHAFFTVRITIDDPAQNYPTVDNYYVYTKLGF